MNDDRTIRRRGQLYRPRGATAFAVSALATGAFLIPRALALVRRAHPGITVRTRDGSMAAHYEHTVVITHGRPLFLTAA